MDFVIMGNPWHFAGNNPTSKHHVAEELASLGHRVLWINCAGMRAPKLRSGGDRQRVIEKIRLAFRGLDRVKENIWVLSPLILPLPQSRVARWLNCLIYRFVAWWGVRRLRLERPVLMSFFLMVPSMLKRWPFTAIYYCVDKWDAFERYDGGTMSMMNRESCMAADIVLASSAGILSEVRKYNVNAHLIPHGVKHGHFARALAHPGPGTGGLDGVPLLKDLPTGRIAGFFGLIDERVDHELLLRVARECGNCHVVVIGKADSDLSWTRTEPNIHWLGPKPFDELPGYVARFSVGLIPYVLNDQTDAINPIKLREMLAAGCPVVSTNLPESVAMAGEFRLRCHDERLSAMGMVVAGNDNEFVNLVKQRLDNLLTTAEKLALSRTMADETWTSRVRDILRLIEAANHRDSHDGVTLLSRKDHRLGRP